MKFEAITLKIETSLYEEAKAIFEKEGYTVEEAITMFFKACIACNGFPFPVTKEEFTISSARWIFIFTTVPKTFSQSYYYRLRRKFLSISKCSTRTILLLRTKSCIR